MGFIRCEEHCTFQKDGYCEFDKLTGPAAELSAHSSCVYYRAREKDGADI